MTAIAAHGMTRILARGIGWNYLSSAISLMAQLAYTAATARLLTPHDFGAYAAALALWNLATYFTMTALGNAVLRDEDKSPELIGTAIRLSLACGLVTSFAVAVAAPGWANLWNAPSSVGVIRTLALATFFSAAATVPIALIRARLRYRTAALIEAVSQVSGMVFGVALALKLRSPVALASGQAVGMFCLFVGGAVAARSALSFAFDRSCISRLTSFAGQVSGQNLVYYTIYTVPAWFIARVFGSAILGIYSRANVIFGLPANHLSVGLTRALYPLYSRSGRDPSVVRDAISFSLEGVSTIIWPLFAAAAGMAPVIIALLLGPGWADASDMMPALALFYAVNLALVVVGNPIEAKGYFSSAWALQAAWLALLGGTMLAAWAAGLSATELLFAFAGVQVLVHAVQVFVAAHFGFVDVRTIARLYPTRIGRALCFYLVPAVLHVAIGHRTSVGLELVADAIALTALASLLVRSGIADFRRWLQPEVHAGGDSRGAAVTAGSENL